MGRLPWKYDKVKLQSIKDRIEKGFSPKFIRQEFHIPLGSWTTVKRRADRLVPNAFVKYASRQRKKALVLRGITAEVSGDVYDLLKSLAAITGERLEVAAGVMLDTAVREWVDKVHEGT